MRRRTLKKWRSRILRQRAVRAKQARGFHDIATLKAWAIADAERTVDLLGKFEYAVREEWTKILAEKFGGAPFDPTMAESVKGLILEKLRSYESAIGKREPDYAVSVAKDGRITFTVPRGALDVVDREDA